MTTIKTSKGEFLIFPITQKGACNFKILFGRLEYLHDIGYTSIALPQSLVTEYTFLCTTDTITEDIAKGIVDENKVGYINYLFGNNHIGQNVNHHHRSFQVALRSFNSLLQSHNLLIDKTYAICKKN